MREVLDRLREAETALDRKLSDVYFETHGEARNRVLSLLLAAKSNIWLAQMQVLDAAAGDDQADATESKPASYEDTRAAYEAANPPLA